jgi:hypothetical protein
LQIFNISELAVPDSSCDVATNFECWSDGVFPDIANCRAFYDCALDEGDNLVVDAYQCNAGYVFDPTEGGCVRATGRNCITASCDGSDNFYSVVLRYPRTAQYVALCAGAKSYVMLCPRGTTPNVNSGFPASCDVRCRFIGKNAHSEDNSKYYECDFANGIWSGILKNCPQGQIFNARTRSCQK